MHVLRPTPRRIAAVTAGLLGLGGLVLASAPAQADQTDTFSYAGPAVTIPNNDSDHPAVAGVDVSGLSGTVTKVVVTIGGSACDDADAGISHPAPSQLELRLVAPSGQSVLLVDNVREGAAAIADAIHGFRNFCQTVLDDSASTQIGDSGTHPSYTGTFRPSDSLSAFDGVAPNGTWKLTATDNRALVSGGVLRAFSVTITTDAAPPTIHVSSSPTATVGVPFSFTPTITGSPAPTITQLFDATDGPLPAGLSLDTATGEISGTPAVGSGGQYRIRLMATNDLGSAQDGFYIFVNEAASITGPATASGPTGVPFSYTPTVGGYPAPTVTASNLPPGLSVDPTTGAITGTPTTDGHYDTVLTATNGVGSPATLNVSIDIVTPPITGLAPTITGLAQVGQTLTANPGPVDPADSMLSYQWKADGTNIPGATGSTLVLTPDLAGARIKVRIKATHDGYLPETETSPATPYVRELVNKAKLTLDPKTVAQGQSAEAIGQGLVPGASYKITFLGLSVHRTADEYGEIHVTLDTSSAPISNDVVTLTGGPVPQIAIKAVLKVTRPAPPV